MQGRGCRQGQGELGGGGVEWRGIHMLVGRGRREGESVRVCDCVHMSVEGKRAPAAFPSSLWQRVHSRGGQRRTLDVVMQDGCCAQVPPAAPRHSASPCSSRSGTGPLPPWCTFPAACRAHAHTAHGAHKCTFAQQQNSLDDRYAVETRLISSDLCASVHIYVRTRPRARG